MDKPFIVMKNELINRIVSAINESGLDICIVEMILEDIMRDVSRVVDRETKKQMEEYANHMACAEGIAPDDWTPPSPSSPEDVEFTEVENNEE